MVGTLSREPAEPGGFEKALQTQWLLVWAWKHKHSYPNSTPGAEQVQNWPWESMWHVGEGLWVFRGNREAREVGGKWL